MLAHGVRVASRPEWIQFGSAHLVALGLILLGCINIAYFWRELRGLRVECWLTAGMIALHGAKVVYAASTGFGGLDTLLPLHTCYASMFLAVAWCVTKRQWIGHVLVLWTLVGGVISALMPDTYGYTFPSFVVVQTFAYHALMLWLGMEIWLVEGVRPSVSATWSTVVVTGALFPLAIAANAGLGTNYLFLSSDPGGIFSYLGQIDGIARIVTTAGTGFALLLVAMAAWAGLDALGRAGRARKAGSPSYSGAGVVSPLR